VLLIRVNKLPAPLALEVAWAVSVKGTVPVPIKVAKSLALVKLNDFEPLAVLLPKSWPLVPEKSIVPSKALASKDWWVEILAISELIPGADKVIVPETVPTTVAGAWSKLST
jgi:hypothetical protein